MRAKALVLLPLLTGTLLSCAPDPGITGVPGVREATAAEVASCAYVADITMKPGVYGALEQQGITYARNRIKQDARDGGANTVVFGPPQPGDNPYLIRAVAYRC